MKNKKNIAIIGAGASGLIAGITASLNGHNVTIYEKNNKIGKKILATGNGRCNITNSNIKIENFHSNNINLVENILNNFNLKDTLNFFKSIGLLTVEGEKSNRLYPMSLQASSVVSLLEEKAKSLNIQIKLSSHITKVSYNNIFTLIINNNLEYNYDNIILATGSLAQPKLGGCKDGINIAKQFKHNIIPISASLVQLVSDSNILQEISGVKFIGKATLLINKEKVTSAIGDILFTKYGLSGSAILEISREVAIELQKKNLVEVSIDLFPNFTKLQLQNILNDDINLKGIINQKLIPYILRLSQNNYSKIPNIVKNLNFNIVNTKGFDFCEVVAGGVDMDSIDSNTMQSLKREGLYFCGEVLDVDGDCGGFNLQWAWSSGYLAGNSI
jgi:predicted Rossmann fold flavoprotein